MVLKPLLKSETKTSPMAERKDLPMDYEAEREACMRVVSEFLVLRFGPKK